MKIFAKHDYYFDFCRSFLVIAMVFTHTFEQFYLPDYNRRLTYFVTIGFVLISGFSMGALYSDRVINNPLGNFEKFIKRTGKLFFLFSICNLGIFLFSEERRHILSAMGFSDIVGIAVLGNNQGVFAFDILVPLALTSIFSYLSLLILDIRFNKLYIVLTICIIFFIDTIEWQNHYGVILLLCGIFGCFVGRQLYHTVDWSTAIKVLGNQLPMVLSGSIIICYYAGIVFFTPKGGGLHIGYHLPPSAMLLLFVYMCAIRFRLPDKNYISKISSLVSSYMLFIYLFHILINYLLFFIIPKDSLNMIECIFLGIVTNVLTIIVCQLIKYFCDRSPFFKVCYDAVFKL